MIIHGPPEPIRHPSPHRTLPMVRLIGDDDSWVRWHIAQPPQPVQLSGEPLFRVRSVDFEAGSPCATLQLDCAYINVTAERVSMEVVDWLRLQGPDQRVTLGQLYSPVPKKGTDFSKITATAEGFASSSPLIDGWTWSTDPPAGAGWFAVLLSYEEDGISTHAMVFAGGRAHTFTAGTLLAHAGPFPDQATAEAWGYDHDPDD